MEISPLSLRLIFITNLWPAELSEMQNYAYWGANFCLGMHQFYNARVLRTHVFLIGTCQNSVADRKIHNTGDQKLLLLPCYAYQAAGDVTHCRSVLTIELQRFTEIV